MENVLLLVVVCVFTESVFTESLHAKLNFAH